MYQILEAEILAPNVTRLVIEAPRIARKRQPGQFVIVRVGGRGERIPLTIADVDLQRGTITLIIQAVGATTTKLCALRPGGALSDVCGPLGRPTEVEQYGHVAVVGGGVGTAVIFPQAVALAAAGNRVTAIVGGRTQEYVILEAQLREGCAEVIPCTDDGSYGFKGFVTEALRELIERKSPPVDAVFTAGPVPMMRVLAELTREYGIHTVASLNPIMVDGTGMCGGCRVTVNGEMKFACVDGPEFDAHQVDFAELADRLTSYHPQERAAFDRVKEEMCRLEAAAAKISAAQAAEGGD